MRQLAQGLGQFEVGLESRCRCARKRIEDLFLKGRRAGIGHKKDVRLWIEPDSHFCATGSGINTAKFVDESDLKRLRLLIDLGFDMLCPAVAMGAVCAQKLQHSLQGTDTMLAMEVKVMEWESELEAGSERRDDNFKDVNLNVKFKFRTQPPALHGPGNTIQN